MQQIYLNANSRSLKYKRKKNEISTKLKHAEANYYNEKFDNDDLMESDKNASDTDYKPKIKNKAKKNKFPNEHNALYHLPGIISFRKFNVLGLATLVLPVYSYFRCCPLYNVIDFIIRLSLCICL